jgi:hypothetical protein
MGVDKEQNRRKQCQNKMRRTTWIKRFGVIAIVMALVACTAALVTSG